MESSLALQCPFQRKEYTVNLAPLLSENIFQRTISDIREFLSRLSLASFKNAWRIGYENDLSKTFVLAWKEGSLISKCPTPKGTIYLTADQGLMKAILQNHRKDPEGFFLDHENKKLFIKGIIQDIFPEDINHFGIDKAAEMIMISASSPLIKLLRAPLVSMLSSNCVKEFLPQMNDIADNILNSLSDQEKENCNAEQLAFEFAVTVISKFVTGYNTNRTGYLSLAHSLNAFSKRMTRIVSHRPATKIEEEEYQIALNSMRNIIEENLQSDNPSSFVAQLKKLGWNDFQIRVNLFFMYFSASETTASSINYLLWQLGKPENKLYIDKIKNDDDGSFLQKIVAETLRLHPPAFVIGRQFGCNTLLEVKDQQGKVIKKIKLRRGNLILCLSQVAALNPENYKNPTHFNPERFRDVPSQLPWYPFGTGNHVCPGQHLAHAEIKVFISRIVNKFLITTISPQEQTQQKGFFTLRATPGQIKLGIKEEKE